MKMVCCWRPTNSRWRSAYSKTFKSDLKQASWRSLMFIWRSKEVLKTEKEKLRANAELMHARYRYQLLTGLQEMPAEFEEQQAPITNYAQSPIWLEAVSKVNLAETELRLAEVESRENPQVMLNVRSIQGGFDFTNNNSMGIKIRIPFGSDVRTAPIKAAAASEVGNAMTNQETILHATRTSHARSRT